MKRAAITLLTVMFAAGLSANSADIGNVYVDENSESGVMTLNVSEKMTSVKNPSEAVKSGANNLQSLLELVPGVYMTGGSLQAFGAGTKNYSAIKIRGLGTFPNPGILAVIDGVPQSMALFRHPLFDGLGLESAHSVEIVTGPDAVEEGNMAMAGVIKVTPVEKPKEGLSLKAGTSLGNYYTHSHFINASYGLGTLSAGGSASYDSTGGYRPNSDAYLQDYNGFLRYAISDGWYAKAKAGYSYNRVFNPGPASEKWDREQEAVKMILRSADVRVGNEYTDMKGEAIAYAQTGSNDFIKQLNPAKVLVTGAYTEFTNYGARLFEEFNLYPGNVIKTGFDWQYFGGSFDNRSANPAFLIRKYSYENDYAIYAKVSQEVGILGLSFGARYAINTKWGNELLPSYGLKLMIFDGNTLFANAARGYRTPAAGTVMFAKYGELKPESIWQYEAGTMQKIGEDFEITAALFQNEGANLLAVDPVDGTLKNTGVVFIRGVEAGAAGVFFKALKLGGWVSYLDPREKTAGQACFTSRAYAEAEPFEKLKVRIEAETARERFDADNRRVKLEEYTVFNGSIKYGMKVWDVKADFYLNAENIFNRNYQAKAGYPGAGFVLKSGLVLEI